MSRIGMSRFTLSAKCTILVIVQHPLSADDISNEMLAFQANIVCVQGAGKTRSGSDRPHEECKAFRMEGADYPHEECDISNEALAFQANIVCVQGAGKTRSGSNRPHEECKAFRMEGAAYLSDKENHHEKNTDCCRYAE